MSDEKAAYYTQVSDLLDSAVKNRASDLHLSADLPPTFRIDGELKLFDYPVCSNEAVLGR
jgi:twitching motility protein PilT